MTENTQTNTSGGTNIRNNNYSGKEEEPAVVGGTIAVAVEIMMEVVVEAEAEAEDTQMTLQRRAVTLEQFSRAP